MTEFKPGDVVSVSHPVYDDGPYRAIVRARRAAGDALEVALDNGGFDILSDAVEQGDVRPLVVIDPEDREQIERLAEAIDRADYDHGGKYPDVYQAALRSLVSPPRPVEPLGLGAVVEDDISVRWVRVNTATGTAEWRCTEPVPEHRRYADIAVVKVLSEGVTQ
jgi:hypothetical protein